MDRLERVPPHDSEAEKSVLGAILINKEVFYQVSEEIGASDFYADSHREIFEAMTDLFQNSEPIDAVTVANCLKKRKTLEAAGGRAYIALLSSLVPTTANAVPYARIVREKSQLRRLINAAGGIVSEAYSEAVESGDVIDNAEKAILAVAGDRQHSEYSDIKKVLGKNIAHIQEVQRSGLLPGLPTGYKNLDGMLTGLQKADMIIIAARPSMGKTAFALNIAQHAALKAGARVVIFSLEMSKEQLGMRLLSMEARIDSRKLREGDIEDEDWASINAAVDSFSKADITIDDTPGIGVMEMRNKCRRIAARKPIDLIIVDYLQMMTAGTRNLENRQQEITYISRYLKQLAREMNCPVMVLSQLSRAVEQRGRADRRPMLSDLRESGAIEQDADVVMFLYRDDYYKTPEEQQSSPMHNICEVIVAKQRNGEIGTVKLTWRPRFTKFADIGPNVSST